MSFEIQEAAKREQQRQLEWAKKHRLLLHVLNLSPNEAMNYNNEIEALQTDLVKYLKAIGIVCGLIIVIASFMYSYYRFIPDILKRWNLVANFLGLAGTFFGFYGFLFNRKGLMDTTNQLQKNYSLHYAYPERCFESIVEYINDHNKQHQQEGFSNIKLELRKQISIFIAFAFITISFYIQFILQFY